jgi:hypothetical protein
MGGRGHAAAFIGLLMLLQVAAIDDQQPPFATPDSARDLEARREADRERSRSDAEQEGR